MRHTLMMEPHLSRVPPKAFRLPKSFHINIRSFRADTADAIAARVQRFSRLDVPTLLKADHGPVREALASTATSFSDSREAFSELPQGEYIGSDCPLRVTVRGLGSLVYSHPAGPTAMFVYLNDPTDRLRSFIKRVREQFSVGDVRPAPTPTHGTARSLPLGPSVIDLSKVYDQKEFRDKFGNKTKVKRYTLDATEDVIQRYKDTVWVEGLKLQKLSICKEGRIAKFDGPKNGILLDEYYEEIASVPLPQ